jgi:hypothetical protein
MLLSEVLTPFNPTQSLLNRISFTIYPQETQVLSQKLEKIGQKPTISNIKNYMIRWLLVPIDEVPMPERTIILRSGRPERN